MNTTPLSSLAPPVSDLWNADAGSEADKNFF